MNLASWIILALTAVGLAAALAAIWKSRKSGSCSPCEGCSRSGRCPLLKKC